VRGLIFASLFARERYSNGRLRHLIRSRRPGGTAKGIVSDNGTELSSIAVLRGNHRSGRLALHHRELILIFGLDSDAIFDSTPTRLVRLP
jgi:hypothetical protein